MKRSKSHHIKVKICIKEEIVNLLSLTNRASPERGLFSFSTPSLAPSISNGRFSLAIPVAFVKNARLTTFPKNSATKILPRAVQTNKALSHARQDETPPSLSLSLLPREPDLLFENTAATFSCSGSTIWAGAGAGKRGRNSGNWCWIPNWSWCSDLGSLLEKKRRWEEKRNSCREKERNRNVNMEVTRNWGKERISGKQN